MHVAEVEVSRLKRERRDPTKADLSDWAPVRASEAAGTVTQGGAEAAASSRPWLKADSQAAFCALEARQTWIGCPLDERCG